MEYSRFRGIVLKVCWGRPCGKCPFNDDNFHACSVMEGSYDDAMLDVIMRSAYNHPVNKRYRGLMRKSGYHPSKLI